MKTYIVETFPIGELTEKEQHDAHEKYLQLGDPYAWMDEGIGAMKEFCELLGVKVRDYELSTFRPSYIRFDLDHDQLRGVKASRVPKPDAGGTTNLTGYCIGIDMLYKFHEASKENHGDMRKAVAETLDGWVKNMVADMEDQETFEYFVDMAEVNEWHFRRDGTMDNRG